MILTKMCIEYIIKLDMRTFSQILYKVKDVVKNHSIYVIMAVIEKVKYTIVVIKVENIYV